MIPYSFSSLILILIAILFLTFVIMELTVDIKNKKFYNSFLYFLKSLHIEIVSKEKQKKKKEQKKTSLKGTLIKFDDPFGPVADSLDWDVLK